MNFNSKPRLTTVLLKGKTALLKNWSIKTNNNSTGYNISVFNLCFEVWPWIFIDIASTRWCLGTKCILLKVLRTAKTRWHFRAKIRVVEVLAYNVTWKKEFQMFQIRRITKVTPQEASDSKSTTWCAVSGCLNMLSRTPKSGSPVAKSIAICVVKDVSIILSSHYFSENVFKARVFQQTTHAKVFFTARSPCVTLSLFLLHNREAFCSVKLKTLCAW